MKHAEARQAQALTKALFSSHKEEKAVHTAQSPNHVSQGRESPQKTNVQNLKQMLGKLLWAVLVVIDAMVFLLSCLLGNLYLAVVALCLAYLTNQLTKKLFGKVALWTGKRFRRYRN